MSSNRFSMPARIVGVASFCFAAAVCAQTQTHEAAGAAKQAATTSQSSGSMKSNMSNSSMNSQASTISSSDRKFMDKAAQGGMAEVKLGELATQKAQSDQVKQF